MYFYVYIIKCSDSSYYTGHTENLEKRVWEHNNGIHHCYTYFRRPLTLVYSEKFTSRIEALEAERKIKKWNRNKKEHLIKYGWCYFLQKQCNF
jgi:predicted GIY-YIG superfamily endonuclease